MQNTKDSIGKHHSQLILKLLASGWYLLKFYLHLSNVCVPFCTITIDNSLLEM